MAGPGWVAAAPVKGTASPTPANVKTAAANCGHGLEPRTLMLIAPFASHNASQLAARAAANVDVVDVLYR
jgi:hypothetical protein